MDSPGQFKAIRSFRSQIADHQIGFMFLRKLQALSPIICFTDNLQAAFLARFRSEEAQADMDTRRIWLLFASATDGPAGVLDSTSSTPDGAQHRWTCPDPPPQ
jgi:hypothetical protein